MTRDCMSAWIAGLGIGTAIGILMAPKRGEETRSMINDKAHEGREYLRDQANNLRSSAADLVDRGKQEIGRRKTGIAEAIDAGKDAYRKASAAG